MQCLNLAAMISLPSHKCQYMHVNGSICLGLLFLACTSTEYVHVQAGEGGRERDRERRREGERGHTYKLIIYITDYWMPSSMQ